MGDEITLFRNELKYMISLSDYITMKNRLRHFLKADRFGGQNNEYHVRSLYFDDVYDSCLFEKLSGVYSREKFRIRIYNLSDRIIKFERKYKEGQFVLKKSTAITRDECNAIIEGKIDLIKNAQSSLLQKFYIKSRNSVYKPAVVVDYVREAYTHSVENIRITFDKKLKTCFKKTDIFNPDLPTFPAINTNSIILEIKFNRFLPDYIKNIISISSLQRLSISKYLLCREVNIKNIEVGY